MIKPKSLVSSFKPVFTPAGAAFLVIALVILIRSLLARNSYEIALSCAALLLLLFTGIFGVWKSRKFESLEPGWKPPFPMTANAGEETLITGLDTPVPLFFRLHFIVRGRFFPEGFNNNERLSEDALTGKIFSGGCPVSAETSVPRGQTQILLPFDFPMSGIFHGDGFCRLRDIFGFFSFPCGKTQRRTVNIRSAPCFGKNYHINAQSGAEDRRNKHTTNEERYYMREYTPGDRFRDINWKSSEKVDSLITRISPDNQEKISRIEVYFRNYGPANANYREQGKNKKEKRLKNKRRRSNNNKPQSISLEALWLLDRAKARLSHFLRSIMEQNSSFIFSVRTAQGKWEIEDQDDLDAFLEELAGFSFSPPQNEGAAPVSSQGELYVFSTACDFGLPGFIIACNPRPVSLYLVQPAEKRIKNNEQGAGKDIETLYIRNFMQKGCTPSLKWQNRKRVKPLGAHAGRTEMIYAETKI